MQFAPTAIFHILWPVLTNDLGIYLVVEVLWLRTQNPDSYNIYEYVIFSGKVSGEVTHEACSDS